MSEEELHLWWRQTNGYDQKSKVQHLMDNWNVEAARTVLNAWQRKFVEVRHF